MFGFVHKNWFEHLMVILVKREEKDNWFIVVQSSLTYIHYLDQPSQGFNQSTINPSESKTTFTCNYKVSLPKLNPLQTQRVIKLLYKRRIE